MRKLFAAVCCAALLAGSIGMVCPAAEPESESDVEKTAEEQKQIGEKEKGALKAKLTNASGKDIREFAIKEETEEDFTENLLAEGDVFADEEVRTFYYMPKDQAAGAETEAAAAEAEAADAETEASVTDSTESGTEAAENEETKYVILLTFEDDTTAELHAFAFSKIKKAKILLEEGTAYLVYKDGEEKVSTLEAEQELAAEAQAQAAAQADDEIEVYDDFSIDLFPDSTPSESAPSGGNAGGGNTGGGNSAGNGGGGRAAENCLQGGLMN